MNANFSKFLKFKQFKLINNSKIFILALFWGTLYSLYLVGSKIYPFNSNWLLYSPGDSVQHFLGWLFFKQDNWYWPLTVTKNLAYPIGTSISYTDSIPICAIFFKLFSGFLANNFQYFGCFMLLSFILQFFWGAKLGMLFSSKSLFCATVSGLLFMLAPPLNWRVHGHIALISHWLILAAFWSYFSLRRCRTIKKIVILQLLGIIIASGIHPYIAILTTTIIVTSYLQLSLDRKLGMIKVFFLITLSVFLLGLGWYFFGYFVTNSSVGGSYGFYSLNLTSLFNPQTYSIFLKPLPLPDGQYEGFNYLGLGVLLLLVTNFIKWLSDRKFSAESIKNIWLLLGLSILLTGFALSNKIYWQNTLVLSYPLPIKIEHLFSTFRASSRFFWPVHYLILLGLLVYTFKSWTSRSVKVLLTLIVCIQFLDLIPLHLSSSKWIHTPPSKPLLSEEWKYLSQTHDRLIVLPSFQCGGTHNFPVFERLASLQGMKTNSAYLARYSQADLDFHCQQLPKLVASGRLESKAAYVLDPKFFLYMYVKGNDNPDSHYCYEVDDRILCINHKLGLENKTAKIMASPYSMNEVLYFDRTENNSLKYQVSGWSYNELGGTWTDGTEAYLAMQIEKPVQNPLTLRVEAVPLLHEKHPQQVVDVSIDRQRIAHWIFERGKPMSKYTATIPANLIKLDSPLIITFRFLNPMSPLTLGLSEDRRLLGLNFRKLQLTELKTKPSA